MSTPFSDPGAQKRIYINWPGYTWRFVGLGLSLFLTALGRNVDSIGLTLLGVVLVILFLVLIALSLYALNRSSKLSERRVVEYLYNLSQTRASDTLTSIDLGLKWPAIAISQHLTSGQMHVIDIYNPQLMPAKSLIRARRQGPPALLDPRLDWYDSNLDLLPLPDGSVDAVFLYHVLSQIAQRGDQKALLKEVVRILKPGGRLLFAELASTWPNRLLPGSAFTNLHNQDYWSKSLGEAGFEVRREETLQGIETCVRADKPSPYTGKQMSLGLAFEAAE